MKEWVWDTYSLFAYEREDMHARDIDAFDTKIINDPVFDSKNFKRVCRGGGWDSSQNKVRCAHRNKLNASRRYNDLGFRIVRSVE